MKKYLAIIVSVLACICIVLSGCGNSNAGENASVNDTVKDDTVITTPSDDEIKVKISGIWATEYKGSKLVYQFNEDGTGMASIIPMTYTVKDGVITITVSAFGKTETGSATYSVSDDTLLLTKDGDTIVMKKTTMEELEK